MQIGAKIKRGRPKNTYKRSATKDLKELGLDERKARDRNNIAFCNTQTAKPHQVLEKGEEIMMTVVNYGYQYLYQPFDFDGCFQRDC